MAKKLTEGSVVLVSDKVGDKVTWKDWDIGTLLWIHPDGDVSVMFTSRYIHKCKAHLVSPYTEETSTNIESDEHGDETV